MSNDSWILFVTCWAWKVTSLQKRDLPSPTMFLRLSTFLYAVKRLRIRNTGREKPHCTGADRRNGTLKKGENLDLALRVLLVHYRVGILLHGMVYLVLYQRR
jgi:hypothetical protein